MDGESEKKIMNLYSWNSFACLGAIRLLAAPLFKLEQQSLSRHEKGLFWATDDTAAAATFSLTFEPSVNICTSFWCLDVISKKLVYTLQGLWCLFYILSNTARSEVQIDSKEGYLTLWCHQPYPSQSLNPQTVVEFEGQGVNSGWIFEKVLSLMVQKHSYKLDYQDKFLVLKHTS